MSTPSTTQISGAALAACIAFLTGCPPSGQPDAGTPTPDGGEGEEGEGEDPCADVPLHPTLGTATLGAGFTVVTSVALDPSLAVVALTAFEEGAATRIFSVDRPYGEITELGMWPTLDLWRLVGILNNTDDLSARISPLLTTDGEWAAAGARLSDQDGSQSWLLLADVTEQFGRIGLRADNIFHGAFMQHTLVVSATALADDETSVSAGGAPAFFARTETGALSRVATLDGGFSAPGFIAPTGAGVVVMSGALSATEHLVFAVPTSDVEAALLGAPPIDLTTSVLVADGDVLGVAAFQAGVAVLRGVDGSDDPALRPFHPPNAALDLRRFPLSVDGTAVIVGEPETILSFPDACTQVGAVARLREGILVALYDANGGRLVELGSE